VKIRAFRSPRPKDSAPNHARPHVRAQRERAIGGTKEDPCPLLDAAVAGTAAPSRLAGADRPVTGACRRTRSATPTDVMPSHSGRTLFFAPRAQIRRTGGGNSRILHPFLLWSPTNEATPSRVPGLRGLPHLSSSSSSTAASTRQHRGPRPRAQNTSKQGSNTRGLPPPNLRPAPRGVAYDTPADIALWLSLLYVCPSLLSNSRWRYVLTSARQPHTGHVAAPGLARRSPAAIPALPRGQHSQHYQRQQRL
jgi:hypothetical protein